MNPTYGILAWIAIGALAGWIGSKLMGTDGRQGGLANVGIGVTGAVAGGFLSRLYFGDNVGTSGLIASFLIALAGSCVVIFVWRAAARAAA